MTTPNLNNPIADKFGLLQTAWVLYFQNLFRGILGSAQPLAKLTAAPSNAAAAAAGVQVGQLYTTTADPAIVYIRTL